MTDMIDELRRYASLWVNDPTVPDDWREANAPEVTWGELDGVAGMCYRAADALTTERSQREAAERKLADMTAEPLCLLSDYAAMRAERDSLTAALAAATRERDMFAAAWTQGVNATDMDAFAATFKRP